MYIRACLVSLFLPALLNAQPEDPRLREKLASPFLKKARWNLDLDNARAQARKTGRLILGYFTTTGP